MEILNGQDDGPIQAAAEGLFGAALVRDERLQHGTYHVQLEREGWGEGQGVCLAWSRVGGGLPLPVSASALTRHYLEAALSLGRKSEQGTGPPPACTEVLAWDHLRPWPLSWGVGLPM